MLVDGLRGKAILSLIQGDQIKKCQFAFAVQARDLTFLILALIVLRRRDGNAMVRFLEVELLGKTHAQSLSRRCAVSQCVQKLSSH